MHKLLLLFLLASTFATKAFGGLISAETLTVGDNITNAFGSAATLNWVNKGQNQPASFSPLIVNQANTEFPGNHSRYLGASNGHSGTFNLFDYYLEQTFPTENYSEAESVYQAIAITFTQPVSGFGFRAESFNSDEQIALLFDTEGNFISHEWIESEGFSGNYGVPISNFNHTFDLADKGVGSIILGSWSSASYYYELSIEGVEPTGVKVPEPSSALLVILALAALGASKTLRRTMSHADPCVLDKEINEGKNGVSL